LFTARRSSLSNRFTAAASNWHARETKPLFLLGCFAGGTAVALHPTNFPPHRAKVPEPETLGLLGIGLAGLGFSQQKR
jgi:hypothetical protein